MMRAGVTAVLGPTNTGKTHLAVERLCGHASGVMGFPLRLLAREIYDRVVAIKGAASVGLITGEEKILPTNARWLLCTAESMPLDRDVAFVALDEAQLGADPERGHIFTDRLLNARGREETMLLGSESLRPMVRALVPEAEIVTRPRFSKLSFAGAKKLSRLPPRSAIIAFSVEEVYAIAELLRRTRGGSAVVMGALSPRTRNAQIAMYQAGEVDYLVATDAIGMGLNMDVGHIAFASLSKFDGKRQRRLTIPEMAQIAGRAGRHQRDGTFGTLAGLGKDTQFSEAEVERIEEHRFKPLDHLYWRNAEPDFTTLAALIESLEQIPVEQVLRAAPEAIDLAVLRQLSGEAAILERTTGPAAIARLWDVCGLPDFRKTGADYHARLVARIYEYRMTGAGHIPAHVIADELARLDNVQGDIDTLAARIASARTWAYAAHRSDWLANPGEWVMRASTLEEKLSDALHARLTERFVDRRTTVLMRSLGNDAGLLDVDVSAEGAVTVEGEAIGTLAAFRFTSDPSVSLGERKRLLAAAETRLPKELARRAARLAEAPDHALALSGAMGAGVTILWNGNAVATLERGADWLTPRIVPDAGLDRVADPSKAACVARIQRWIAGQLERRMSGLLEARAFQDDPATPAPLRAILAQLVAEGGCLSRDAIAEPLAALSPDCRRALGRVGFVIGALDLFHPLLLKPEATRWRLALLAVYHGNGMPPLPMAGLGLLDKPDAALASAAHVAGFRRFGDQMLRVDLVERIARALHDQRGGDGEFEPDAALAVSLGVGGGTLARMMRALGFVPLADGADNRWRWRGRRAVKRDARPDNPAFAALGGLPRRTKR
jgi:ATP-dependent RNA helicase SUPV3L1/SUV3